MTRTSISVRARPRLPGGSPAIRKLLLGFCRVGDIHVSHCQEKSTRSLGRSGERATGYDQDLPDTQQLPLGWWSLHPAGPDIHLLSKTLKNPHRRLSLCSLPVPKQSKRASGVSSIAQSPTCGTWQPAHRIILMVFHSTGSSYAAALPANSPAGTKSCFLRSTASK
jgi:hypothetical protein